MRFFLMLAAVSSFGAGFAFFIVSLPEVGVAQMNLQFKFCALMWMGASALYMDKRMQRMAT